MTPEIAETRRRRPCRCFASLAALALLAVAGTALAPAATAVTPASAAACKVQFSVVQEDTLGNINAGFSKKKLKWYEHHLAKKYPAVCYIAPGPSDSLFLYFGAASGLAYFTTGRVGASGSYTASTLPTRRTAWTLSIIQRQANGHWQVRCRFAPKISRKRLFLVIATDGLGAIGLSQRKSIFTQAIKWLATGGLTDPMETAAQAR